MTLPTTNRPRAVLLEQGVVTSQSHRHTLRDLITARKIAKAKRDREQRALLDDDLIWHDQILAKLKTDDRIDPITGHWYAPTAQMENFARCGHEHVYRTCTGCDETTAHTYHCMIKWCPLCNWRITSRRRDLLKQWLPLITQPKHLVTTQRNTRTITRSMIKQHTVNLSKLRRSKAFSQVKGGCVSVEVTNESRGWHLHAHWLVDARWIDQGELSRTWGRLVGQDYAIVKVLDARNKPQYQRELMKYVAKGSTIARWPADEILQFITAIRSQRFFFAFGSLFKEARRLRALAEANKPPAEPCDCGCTQYVIHSDRSMRERAKRKRR